MITRFSSDKKFLTRYHASSFYTVLALSSLMAFIKPFSVQEFLWYLPIVIIMSSTKIQIVLGVFIYACVVSMTSDSFHWIYLSAIPVAILLTFPLTALLHSASHGSLRPKWLNRPVGELVGLMQLSGFAQWKIVHVVHHKHADDPDLDPHPPQFKSYWEFTKGMRESAIKAYAKFYLKTFGDNNESGAELKRFGMMAKLDQSARVLLWYLVLGPQLFTFLFLASIVFKMFHYAWFNYITHRPTGNEIEVKNLDSNLYYIINRIAFGLYYHKNHHLYPLLFNPRYLAISKVAAKNTAA